MKRWHESKEEALMSRRWRTELEKHTDRNFGQIVGGCHCLGGKGSMRKARPYEKCGGHCSVCTLQREEKRRARRKVRRAERAVIVDQLG